MKIGIDMDSVIAEILGPMVEFHNRKYFTTLTSEDHTMYDLSAVWRCSPNEVLTRIYEYYESSFFDSVQPVEGSLQGVEYLYKKYDLYLITSRPHIIENKTASWLNTFFPGKFKKICHTNQISQEHEIKKMKSTVCKEEGIMHMIDDAPDYALDCASVNIQVYLFSAPWNYNYPRHKHIKPVKGWDEIVQLL